MANEIILSQTVLGIYIVALVKRHSFTLNNEVTDYPIPVNDKGELSLTGYVRNLPYIYTIEGQIGRLLSNSYLGQRSKRDAILELNSIRLSKKPIDIITPACTMPSMVAESMNIIDEKYLDTIEFVATFKQIRIAGEAGINKYIETSRELRNTVQAPINFGKQELSKYIGY